MPHRTKSDAERLADELELLVDGVKKSGGGIERQSVMLF
jgi:hypothetical protein